MAGHLPSQRPGGPKARQITSQVDGQNSGQMGGTMRLGKRQTIFKTEDSVMRKLYGNKKFVEERHRHRYEVNPAMVEEFEKAGMMFVGHDADATR